MTACLFSHFVHLKPVISTAPIVGCDLIGGSLTSYPAIGYLNYPTTTHVDTWLTDMQVISTNRTLGQNATIGCLEGYSIVEGGVINPNGWGLNVGGDATSLGPFNAGGKVILTGNSTAAGIVSYVYAGGTLQCGLDPCATSGRMSGVGYIVQGTAVLNLYGAYTASVNLVGAGSTVAAGGTVNIEGCGTCGTGMINFANNGVTAGGAINMTNSYSVYTNSGMAGTINVNSGASVYTSALTYTGTINLNAGLTSPGNTTNGWKNASCVASPNLIIANGQAQGGNVKVSAAGGSIGSSASNGTFDFSGTLSGTGPLLVTNAFQAVFSNSANAYAGTVISDCGQTQPYGNVWSNSNIILRSGVFLPSSTTVSVKSIQSDTANGTTGWVTVNTPALTLTAQLPEPFNGRLNGNGDINLNGGNLQLANTASASTGRILVGGSAQIGASTNLANFPGTVVMNAATSTLDCNVVGGVLKVGTFTANSGFKVNLDAAYSSASPYYTLLVATTHTNTLPTIGTNSTGFTPTFSWVGTELRVVLA